MTPHASSIATETKAMSITGRFAFDSRTMSTVAARAVAGVGLANHSAIASGVCAISSDQSVGITVIYLSGTGKN
jgi:hypothetical protein